MFGGSSHYIGLYTVWWKCFPTVGFLVDNGFHSQWNKRSGALVMGTVQVGIADTFVFEYAWCSDNRCLPAWGISWHQKCMGKDDTVPHRTHMRCSFHVFIAFSARLIRCLSGGTSWYVIPDFRIASLYALEASLSST